MKTKLTVLILVTAALGTASTQSAVRELAVPESELVPVELASVGVVPPTGNPVALLREPQSGKLLPIFIGPAEARAILMALRDVPVPRPMTHDLMADLLDTFGARLDRVIVDRLSDSTYFGFLKLRRPGDDDPVFVDTRPSDGMALAARTGAPILVAPSVLEAGAKYPFEGLSADEQIATAMGITVVKLTDELREAMKLPDKPGVLISGVDNVTAAAGGIEVGAVILKVNDTAPEDPMAFLELVGKTPPGEKATLRFWHDGREQSLELPTNVPSGSRKERI